MSFSGPAEGLGLALTFFFFFFSAFFFGFGGMPASLVSILAFPLSLWPSTLAAAAVGIVVPAG
jgi:hypothetical protein